MTLGLWEEKSEGVWLNYFTWQQNHRTGLHWGSMLPLIPPPCCSGGGACRSSAWRNIGAVLPRGSGVYGKQQMLLEQMGKFQGIVSKFLAAGLGSHWPVAPKKCACLLQIESRVDLA